MGRRATPVLPTVVSLVVGQAERKQSADRIPPVLSPEEFSSPSNGLIVHQTGIGGRSAFERRMVTAIGVAKSPSHQQRPRSPLLGDEDWAAVAAAPDADRLPVTDSEADLAGGGSFAFPFDPSRAADWPMIVRGVRYPRMNPTDAVRRVFSGWVSGFLLLLGSTALLPTIRPRQQKTRLSFGAVRAFPRAVKRK